MADESGMMERNAHRLNERGPLLAEHLEMCSGGITSDGCRSWVETTAAHCFLGHDRVSWEEVFSAHAQASRVRIRQHAVVLCLQDTTELDYNSQSMSGRGPLPYEAQRGFYLHPSYVVSTEREPLGIIYAATWARAFKKGDAPRDGILEGVRWMESYERIAGQARALPGTRHVCVGDRKSDVLTLLLKARQLDHPADYLVRCQHSRVLPEGEKWWGGVASLPPLGRVRIEAPAGHGPKARVMELEIRVERARLPDRQGGTLDVTLLLAHELKAPGGCKPVCWRILTNRTVSGLAEAAELLGWYSSRREIELFFAVLKEGCRIERLALSDARYLQSSPALYVVIAWRINRLMRLGRTLPDLTAELVFDVDEWRAAYVLNKKPIPKVVPPLNEVLRLIARRGGFVARRNEGEPGPRTIWQGLKQLASCVDRMRVAGQLEVEQPRCQSDTGRNADKNSVSDRIAWI